jgi:hypothetical protein
MCDESKKKAHEEAGSVHRTESAASQNHEDGQEYKDLESAAGKMNFWRAWWRKRRASNDRSPRPASELMAYKCVRCGMIFYAFEPRAFCRACVRRS